MSGVEWTDNYIKWSPYIIEFTNLDLPRVDHHDFYCDACMYGDDEGDCDIDCETCAELAEQFAWQNKDEVNYAIEQWLTNEEEKNEMEENTLCPTGYARMRWVESA
jgi:hypothetical protein